MAPTYTTDVPHWIPTVISTSLYDMMGEPYGTLTGDAEVFTDLQGQPGQTVKIPTINSTTPADNLAETVPAVDDKLTSGEFAFTVKEAVKSIAWSDRTQYQTNQDPNQLAGQRVGRAMLDRIELDLGAALVAGRATAKDTNVASYTLAALRAQKARIPVRLRQRGVTLYGSDDQLSALYEDPLFLNAAATGSNEVLTTGQWSKPLFGVNLKAVEEGVLPQVGGKPVVVMAAQGMFGYAFQKAPGVETERDARARLSRIVGTALHGEGTLEAAGIVAVTIGA